MNKLETLVGRLEALAQGRGLARKKGKPIPWKEFFGVAAAGIQTLSEVLGQAEELASGGGAARTRAKRPTGRIVNQDGTIDAEIMEDDE